VATSLLGGLLNPVLGTVGSIAGGVLNTLNLDGLTSANNISVTTDGVNSTLSSLGFSLTAPALQLSQASQNGNLLAGDGTRLIVGTSGNDTLSGAGDNDAIYGLDGNDQLSGNGGHDYIYGGTGADAINGGDGNDHLYGFGSTAGADGADTITGGSGGDYIQGNSGADYIDAGEDDDRVQAGADNDTVLGGNGNDSINGNFGNDRIDGGAGNDLLRGGKGSDEIFGGDGNDRILGDLGADVLTGGAGADVFEFNGSDAAQFSLDSIFGGPESIRDFQDGVDRIDLGFVPVQIVQGAVAGTVAGIVSFATGLLASQPTGTVASVAVGSDTYLVYNNSGGLLPDSLIHLDGINASAISVADFV
jgi:serralysin